MHPSEKRALLAMVASAEGMLANVRSMLGAAVIEPVSNSPKKEREADDGPSYLSAEEEDAIERRLEEDRLEMLRESELRIQKEFALTAAMPKEKAANS